MIICIYRYQFIFTSRKNEFGTKVRKLTLLLQKNYHFNIILPPDWHKITTKRLLKP